MEGRPLVSFCIPTNGVMDWVQPVLDSIVLQCNRFDLYEIIVADNGTNATFENFMQSFCSRYPNVVYKKFSSKLFLNEVNCLLMASGEFIKFVNHRTCIVSGGVDYIIDFVKEHLENRPGVYFSNGHRAINIEKKNTTYDFDSYVGALSYVSSWTTGMAFWIEDIERLKCTVLKSELFPLTEFLLSINNKQFYCIETKNIFFELPHSSKQKGHYDLYHAFCVEYLDLIKDCERNATLSSKTFESVRSEMLELLASFILQFNVLHIPCSYDVGSLKDSIRKYYTTTEVFKACVVEIKNIFFRRIKRLLRRRKNDSCK